MKNKHLVIAALICGGLIAGTSGAQADSLDQLLARSGQFELNKSKTKTLARGGEIKRYRVCMEEGRGAVPLRVTYDGNEAIVEPGDCQLIEGTAIKLASASKIKEGMTLIGKFNPGGAKRYNTSVSIARAAR